MSDNRSRLRNLTLLGLIIAIAGFSIDTAFGGINDLQATGSPQEFSRIAHDRGNEVRWASWSDILLVVTGYTLFLGALCVRWRRPEAKPVQRRIATWAIGFLATGAFADHIENLMVQLGLGTVDLDSGSPEEVVDPAGWIISVLQVAFAIKWALLGAACLALLALVVLHFTGRRTGNDDTVTTSRTAPDS